VHVAKSKILRRTQSPRFVLGLFPLGKRSAGEEIRTLEGTKPQDNLNLANPSNRFLSIALAIGKYFRRP